MTELLAQTSGEGVAKLTILQKQETLEDQEVMAELAVGQEVVQKSLLHQPAPRQHQVT